MCVTTTVNNFTKNPNKYLDTVIGTNETVCVATDRGNAILMSEEEYNGLKETAYLNSIPGLADRILEGRGPNEETFTVDWKNEL